MGQVGRAQEDTHAALAPQHWREPHLVSNPQFTALDSVNLWDETELSASPPYPFKETYCICEGRFPSSIQDPLTWSLYLARASRQPFTKASSSHDGGSICKRPSNLVAISTSWQLPSTHVPLFENSQVGDRVENVVLWAPQVSGPSSLCPGLMAGGCSLFPAYLRDQSGVVVAHKHWSSTRGAAGP